MELKLYLKFCKIPRWSENNRALCNDQVKLCYKENTSTQVVLCLTCDIGVTELGNLRKTSAFGDLFLRGYTLNYFLVNPR